MTQNFTSQDWAEHEQFVQMFRAAKERKREWQQKMEVALAEKAEKIRKRREEIDKLFENLTFPSGPSSYARPLDACFSKNLP